MLVELQRFSADYPRLTAVFIGITGACVGSFLNVCIARLPLEKSVLWPPGSHCSNCLKAIPWRDNIPLISYWLLGGRCRVLHVRGGCGAGAGRS